jgi:mRNA interferase MazF
MREGDIVLANILMSDGTNKKRPALLLKQMPKYHDLLLCGISSQIQQYLEDFDLNIDNNSKDFPTSGLLRHSIIRLSHLSVIPGQFIEGKIGFISEESHKLLLKRLCEYLMK